MMVSALMSRKKKHCLKIARKTMEAYVSNGKVPPISMRKRLRQLREPFGAFVTLKKDGQLRGCIGRFEASGPLYESCSKWPLPLQPRIPASCRLLKRNSMNIEIEISVLTPLRRIYSIDEFQLGKHGIYMKKGYSSGTFLPQVAQETGWNTEEFLGHCARDKAHIGWDGWKDAELYVYEAYVFGEEDMK